MRIQHTFTQKYHSWGEFAPHSWFMQRSETFDILEKLDDLEVDVYADRDFNLANEMLHEIGINI